MPSRSEAAGELTLLLRAWMGGDHDAGNRAASLVQSELRRIARSQLRREGIRATLTPTELVNESYVRIARQASHVENREHFFALAATLMRRVLVDLARKRHARKRPASALRVVFDEANASEPPRAIDLIALDEALDELAGFDRTEARIVELHFFGGLSFEEVASVLECSPATVYREWRTARLWLFDRLSEKPPVIRSVGDK
jgi:RNA polymerase sigma factor (TIGR02999 family)